MMVRPLALSSDQLRWTMSAARHVPVGFRERFLVCIADQLIDREVTDDAVQSAIIFALERVSRIGDVAA